MSKGDAYVHADFHGAASTVIKNNNKDLPIPLLTIEEAAISSICRSKAWDAKIIASAWWVFDH
jgi:predicted ribosome quality control (RQC) complex YloA/Tae2 family protein